MVGVILDAATPRRSRARARPRRVSLRAALEMDLGRLRNDPGACDGRHRQVDRGPSAVAQTHEPSDCRHDQGADVAYSWHQGQATDLKSPTLSG